MATFDELGLNPSLVEALAAEGIEEPTPLQAEAIPLLCRGTSAVLRAGPGSGLLVTYAAPLLSRVEPGAGQPSVIVLCSNPERAEQLALALSRFAAGTGHTVGALGTPWNEPEASDILLATPTDLEGAVASSAVKLDHVVAIVIETASSLLADASEKLTALLSSTSGASVQLIVAGDPISDGVRQWVDQQSKRTMYLPADAARSDPPAAPTTRGSLRAQALDGPIEDSLPSVAMALLSGGSSHVLVFSRSPDDAADLGDALALRGFSVGRPGDESYPIWLGLGAMESRKALSDHNIDPSSVAAVSAGPPLDADELDRRHGGGWREDVVLLRPREAAHLSSIAREAGYEIAFDYEPPASVEARRQSLAADVVAALAGRDLVPYILLLDPLFRRHGATQVAAALAAALADASRPDVERGAPARPEVKSPARPPPWARLFLSVGRRDGIGARDLLGAILGESGIEADQVGKIEIKDAVSRVEVHDSVAGRVIEALNGTSIRSRSVRVDFDRSDDRGRPPPRGRPGPDRKRRAGA